MLNKLFAAVLVNSLLVTYSLPSFHAEHALTFEKSTANDDLIVERGETLILPSTGSFHARNITVRGTLACSSNAKEGDSVELTAASIYVDGGVFQCTQALNDISKSYKGQLKLIINDDTHPVIEVINGGKLYLRGQHEKQSWGRIKSTVNPGDQKVQVKESFKWSVGDEIVLAPSDYDYTEYETFKILDIKPSENESFVELTFDRPAKYLHYGQTQQFGKRFLQSRAEIALLTRSIKLYGDCDKFLQTKKGISISMKNDALAQINNVEIRCAGHFDVLGAYPVHFHNLGAASGNILSRSSIYMSSNRCLSVHCSDSILIEKNACIDHVGHGYMLEDGSENGNVFRHNLGITTRPGTGNLNPTDVIPEKGGENAGVATYWAAATNNTFFRNTAAGSAWMGFAFDGRNEIVEFVNKTSVCKSRYRIFPWDIKLSVLGLHRGFIAHSTRSSGYWINGFSPNTDYVASKFHVYKTQESGIHMGFNRMLLMNFTISDTQKGMWSTFSSTFRNGVVVGRSALAEVGTHTANVTGKYFGMFVYDGPAAVFDVDFYNFTSPNDLSQEVCHFELNGGGRSSSKHLLAGLTFRNPDRALFCKKKNFQPKLWDLDGSITGEPGSFISNAMETDKANGGFDVLINVDQSCKYLPGTNDEQIVCGPKTESSYLNLNAKDESEPQDVHMLVSIDGRTRNIPFRGGLFNDYQVFLRPNVTYNFEYGGNVKCFGFDMYDMLESEWYHLVFKRPNGQTISANSLTDKLPRVASEQDLFSSTESSQYLEENELHVVIRNVKRVPFHDHNGKNIGLGRSTGMICF